MFQHSPYKLSHRYGNGIMERGSCIIPLSSLETERDLKYRKNKAKQSFFNCTICVCPPAGIDHFNLSIF